MDAALKAKRRIKLFPKYLAECSFEGAVYAKCVVQTDDPKLNQCQKEFNAFRKCLTSAAQRHSSRI